MEEGKGEPRFSKITQKKTHFVLGGLFSLDWVAKNKKLRKSQPCH